VRFVVLPVWSEQDGEVGKKGGGGTENFGRRMHCGGGWGEGGYSRQMCTQAPLPDMMGGKKT